MPKFLAPALLVCALLSLEAKSHPCSFLLRHGDWKRVGTTEGRDLFVARGEAEIERLLSGAGEVGPGYLSRIFNGVALGGIVCSSVAGWAAAVETVGTCFENWSQWSLVGKALVVSVGAALLADFTVSEVEVFFGNLRFGLKAPLELKLQVLEGTSFDEQGNLYYYRFETRAPNGTPVLAGYRELLRDKSTPEDGPATRPVDEPIR